ncbi:hypothetical protein RHGRI_030658 [Rhododendron griersonianum]|uniref:Uncharacterized protein n=1 Tax=Rhododendron griersonianum TaxID=479676 RepID=A0AAV6I5P2_9ERIC|nr:hypothetical protein RHGRI_030658 [Rhododendron griersonianum]
MTMISRFRTHLRPSSASGVAPHPSHHLWRQRWQWRRSDGRWRWVVTMLTMKLKSSLLRKIDIEKHEPNVDLYSVVVIIIFFLFLWIVLVKLDQSMDRPRCGGCSQLKEQTKSSRPPTPWIAAFCSLI